MGITDANEVQVVVKDEWSRNDHYEQLLVCQREAPNHKARLATALIERWGVVAAVPDGESSDGRAKLRKMTPEELVEEATTTADLAVEKFRSMGWMIELPEVRKVSDRKD